jgi:pimeloyl-ACP methyl ester carboxylesterase
MGGKVAQILAGRRARGLMGLVLVAPAPPTPLQVPPEVRAGMLASYQSRVGVIEALKVLAGPTLGDAQREQVIEDTLRGDPSAKRAWPEGGMSADISGALAGLDLPVEIVLAQHDQVEREPVLRPLLAQHFPGAMVTTEPVAGHLVPLEAPQAVAAACKRILAHVR